MSHWVRLVSRKGGVVGGRLIYSPLLSDLDHLWWMGVVRSQSFILSDKNALHSMHLVINCQVITFLINHRLWLHYSRCVYSWGLFGCPLYPRNSRDRWSDTKDVKYLTSLQWDCLLVVSGALAQRSCFHKSSLLLLPDSPILKVWSLVSALVEEGFLWLRTSQKSWFYRLVSVISTVVESGGWWEIKQDG